MYSISILTPLWRQVNGARPSVGKLLTTEPNMMFFVYFVIKDLD